MCHGVTGGLLGAAILISLATGAGAQVREYGGLYTRERIANLRSNCERYEWARAERERVVKAAQRWVALSDDDLWKMVPSQRLPRAIDVSMYRGRRPGCPVCGDRISAFGNYPYNPDVLGKPWKIQCPSCKAVFPTNDFGRYYQSGIDETGCFNPDRADRSLLFNAEHPDPNDPLHTYGVDDGYGWFDNNGNRFLFVAYFVWKLWDELLSGVSALSNAYLYTGDLLYARKTLILLDRIADVYPGMQWKPYAELGYYHSDGGTKRGKIGGSIWETGYIAVLAEAVDRVLPGTRDNPELYAFLAEKARQYKLPGPKGTREDLVRNLDDGILRAGAKAVFEGDAHGNEGMYQHALARCAVALDTYPETEQWLDWLFRPDGGRIPQIVLGQIDRDGVGAEAAPGYALSWGANLGKVADLLAEYGRYTKHDIYRDLPPFAATITAGWNLVVGGFETPNVGDTGSVGTAGRVCADPGFLMRGWRYLHDEKAALAAWWANGQKADGLGRDIFGSDPEAAEKQVAGIAREAGRNPWAGGRNLAGYGLAQVSSGWGRDTRAVWMYYGRNAGHGHKDRLNFDVFFSGLAMLPDHGYPEYATNWPHRNYLTDNTITHNTVVVNRTPQSTNWVGIPEFYGQCEGFGGMRVDSREVYPGLRQYQRTLAQVLVGDTDQYVLDVFRVRGGNDHLYSIHGLPGTVTTEGLQLTPQNGGSYAGPDVEFCAQIPARPGPGYGYSWFTHVERDNMPPAQYSVDWKGQAGYRSLTDKDNIHVRYHGLSAVDDVALADCQPPQNKKGNPQWLRYLLAHRSGQDLTSTFVGLVEPYRDAPVIASVQRLRLLQAPPQAEAVAVKVTLVNGAVDYLVASDEDRGLVRAEGGLEFSGGMGWLRTREGRVVNAVLMRGTRLALGPFSLTTSEPGWTGKIVKMDWGTEGSGHVWVDAALPEDGSLTGQQILIDNDRVRNACYTIQGAERDGDGTKLYLGRVCFVRGFKDPNNPGLGYVYEFEPGAGFLIPLVAQAKVDAAGKWTVTATQEVKVEGG